MPGIRVDRLLASTAIALLLALPATGTFAGSENSPDPSAAPRQNAQASAQAGDISRPTTSEPAQQATNDTAAGTTKPADVAAAASASADRPAGEAKPETKPEAKPETKPAATDAAQADQPAKSAEDKAADSKPADPNPVYAKLDAKPDAKPGDSAPAAANAPAVAAPEAQAPAATAAAPAAAGPDAAISEQLHEFGNGKFDRIVGSKKDRGQIEAFYSSRNYAPMWIT